MRKSVADDQLRALAIATGGATVAAVATMFIPAWRLESFTGATGLSELIPAAAAPLGDTARALIAFAAGAFTLSILAFLLLRQPAETPDRTDEEPVAQSDEPSVSLSGRIASFVAAKMPWNKAEGDITELGDLPKLRNGDSHPDAPPRRPLSAHQDLPVLDLDNDMSAVVQSEPAIVPVTGHEAAHNATVEVEPMPADPEPVQEPVPVAGARKDAQPSLSEMVAQLEAAVADRKRQLAELEAVAQQLGHRQEIDELPASPTPRPSPHPTPRPAPRPLQFARQPLEQVTPSVKDDDMDSALAAALATLHRMNAAGR